jgi:hypothetical protein
MNKFTALLRKDWLVSRRMLLVPVWFTLVSYILLGVAYLSSSSNSNVHIGFYGVDSKVILNRPEVGPAVFLGTNYALVISTGLMCLIFGIIVAGSALNRDLQRNCEVFYRSQPVPLWWLTGSKFIVSVFGAIAALAAISLVNFLAYNGFTWIMFRAGDLAGSLTGLLQGLVACGSVIVFLGGISFMMSGVFRQRAIGITIGLVAGVSVLTTIINSLNGLDIPVLSGVIFNMVSDIVNFSRLSPTMHGQQSWGDILGWMFWRRLILAGLFFIVGSLVYQVREIRQSE